MIKESICKEYITQIAQLRLNIESLKKEKEAFGLRFYKIKEESDSVKQELERVKFDYNELKKSYDNAIKEKQELAESLSRLQNENNILKANIAKDKEKSDNYNAILEEKNILTENNKRLEAMVEQLKEELRKYEGENQELRKELNDLKYIEEIVNREVQEQEHGAETTKAISSKKLIENIFELSPSDGLVLVSKESIELDNGGKILYANTKAFEILRKNGKYLNEMNETEIDWSNPIGVSIYRLFKSSNELRGIYKNIRPFQLEMMREIRFKSGNIIEPIASAISDEAGDILYYVLIFKDLTYEHLVKDITSSSISSSAESFNSLSIVDFRTLQVYHNAKAFREDMEAIANSMTELSQSIADLANSTQDLRRLQDKLNKVFEVNAQNVDELLISFDAMNEVVEHLISMANSMLPMLKDLQANSNQSNQEVDISDAIMLLEMLMEILNRNKESTSKIKGSMKELETEMHSVSDMIAKESSATEEQSAAVRTLAYSFHELTDRINFIYEEIESLKEEIKKTINIQEWSYEKLIRTMRPSNERIMYEKLILAIKYIFNVINSISGNEEWMLKNYTECRFGLWYYQEGKEMVLECGSREIRNLFETIEEPHIKLHKLEKEMHVIYLEDKHKETMSKDLISKMDEFVKTQKSLINKFIELTELVRDKCNS